MASPFDFQKIFLKLVELFRYLNFVRNNFKSFYLIVFLSITVLFTEYLATSLMIPLSQGWEKSSSVVNAWIFILDIFDCSPSYRIWLWLFFVAMIIRLMLGYVLSVLIVWLGRKVHETLSRKVYSHVLTDEPMRNIYKKSVGYYVTLAGDDTFKGGTVVSSFLQIMVSFITGVIAIYVLMQFSFSAFVVVGIFLALSLIFLIFTLRWVLRLNFSATNLSRDLGSTFIESLNGIRSIRSMHAEDYMLATYLSQIKMYLRKLVQVEAVKSAAKTFPAIVVLILAVVFLRPGAEVDVAGATLFAITVIIIRLFVSLGQMITAGAQLATDMRAIQDIDALVRLTKMPAQDRQSNILNAPIRVLSLKEISFGYKAGERILKNITYDFYAGKVYAITGESGAGKSTLADILLGLCEPDSGQVIVNNEYCSLKEFKKHLILVEQQPKIFSTTIRENILLGVQVEENLLDEVIRIVNLTDMVDGLVHGINSKATYLGENLSGGQRQRLGIARALVRKPSILVLDESTSALDQNTRALVVSNLRKFMNDGIIIFITHDDEVASIADGVLAL